MPLGIGLGIWSGVEGTGGPLETFKLDFSRASNSMYIALLFEDF